MRRKEDETFFRGPDVATLDGFRNGRDDGTSTRGFELACQLLEIALKVHRPGFFPRLFFKLKH